MTETVPAEDLIALHGGLGEELRLGSRGAILPLVRALGGCGAGFMLLLTDAELRIIGAWRLGRIPGRIQGFPDRTALALAMAARADGMIVIQEREDPVPRRPDLELTQSLRQALEESGVELLDHLLVAGDALAACRPRSEPVRGTRRHASMLGPDA